MSISICRDFNLKTFEPGALENAIREVCTSLNVDPKNVTGEMFYRHADGLKEDKEIVISDLGSVVLIKTHPEWMYARIADTVSIAISYLLERLQIQAMGGDTLTCAKAIAMLEESLGLEEYKQPSRDTVAILLEERKPKESEQKSEEPEYPAKITISWLSRHAPIDFWFWLIALLVGAFILGAKATSVPWIKQLLG